MNDTSPEAAAIVLAATQGMEPAQRLMQALAHSEAMRELALARLRVVHPTKTTLELVELLLGARLIPDTSVLRR